MMPMNRAPKNVPRTVAVRPEHRHADEDGGEAVQQVTFTHVGLAGTKTRGQQSACNDGKDRTHDQCSRAIEIDPDAGEFSCLAVAANGIDVTAEDCPLHDEPRDAHNAQHEECKYRYSGNAALSEPCIGLGQAPHR